MKHLATYYTRGNGLAESTNKILIRIIKNTILSEQRNRHLALVNALWVDQVMPKSSLNTSTYFLVHGKEAILPPNIYLPALQLSQESQAKPCLLVQCRIDTLHKLQEERKKEKENISLHKSCIKRWFDKNSVKKNEFSVGDLFLKWLKPTRTKESTLSFNPCGSYHLPYTKSLSNTHIIYNH